MFTREKRRGERGQRDEESEQEARGEETESARRLRARRKDASASRALQTRKSCRRAEEEGLVERSSPTAATGLWCAAVLQGGAASRIPPFSVPLPLARTFAATAPMGDVTPALGGGAAAAPPAQAAAPLGAALWSTADALAQARRSSYDYVSRVAGNAGASAASVLDDTLPEGWRATLEVAHDGAVGAFSSAGELIAAHPYATAAVVGAVIAPIAVPAGVAALGFSSAGVVAGSAAATMQATMGGHVAAGGAFAIAQSIGAAGLSAAGTVATASVGAAAGAATAAGVGALTSSAPVPDVSSDDAAPESAPPADTPEL